MITSRTSRSAMLLPIVVSLLSALVVETTPVAASVSAPYTSEKRFPVAPGVHHDQGTMQTTTSGRQAVFLTEIDARNGVITVEGSISNDRVTGLETTTSQGNRKNGEGHRAVAGINGDFWSADAPNGLHIQNGELVTDIEGPDATFGIESDGDALIGGADVTASARRADGSTFPVSRVNHSRLSGQLVVYTARYGAATNTDGSGTEVVLTGVTLPIRSTGTFSGTVAQVRASAGNTAIDASDVVLSGSGDAATYLSVLQVGEQVQLSFAITTGWEQVSNAVGGGYYIVRDGRDVSPADPGFADVAHPRSAIGIASDGRVLFAVVDGRQPGYSTGVTLPELAELMISRGAVTAINLDGGGSSTAAVRKPGYDGLSISNRPSDGYERSVSNSILVFSAAPTGALAYAHVEPADSGFFIGSHANYSARGQDAAYNAVTVSPSSIAWSVGGGVGTIDAAGRFSSTATGSGEIVATIDTVVGQTHVRVVDSLSSLAIAPNPAIVNPGATQQFSVSGRDSVGGAVTIDSNLAAWSISGAIGTIDANGLLTASSSSATGSVNAAVDGASATARVDIGRPPVVLEDFEDITDMKAFAVRGKATLSASMRPDPVRNGTRAARLAYDFTSSAGGAGGTSAAYAAHSPLRAVDARPLRVGVWFYGDGSRHWVRGNYRDGNNVQKVVNFTSPASPTPTSSADCSRRTGGIDWIGWKYLEANIPADTLLPMQWERVYVVETSDYCDNASSVYLDDLRAVYSDTGEDLSGPEVTELVPSSGSTVHTSKPVIGGTVRDSASGSGVAPDSIRLLINGAQVPVQYDSATGEVRHTVSTPLADGTHRAFLDAADNAGNPALPFGDWSFNVYTGPDLDAPVISQAQPLDGTAFTAARPRVSARIVDTYRGVDSSSIRMTVDGLIVPATWDAEAGVAWWAPLAPLADGTHRVTLIAADRETPPNVATAAWSFTVSAMAQPSGAFRVTWIADGGYFEGVKETAATAILAEHLRREKESPPQLLVFGGDLVENDQQINYDRAVGALDALPSPRIVAAGNHEISGSLSRNRFWRTFGPTIAAVDFGPVDFIITDTASSRISYDSSQFEWIEQELSRSDARTVFVVLHVPTRDPFGSGHGLPSVDGQRLESIFAAAKAARPTRDIVVLAGDAHAYTRWMQDGVTYVISGGGGGSPDASPDTGGFYHRLHIAVDATGAATIRLVPLFEAAEVVPSKVLGGELLTLRGLGDVFTATAPEIKVTLTDQFERAWSLNDPNLLRWVDPLQGVVEGIVPGLATVTLDAYGFKASGVVSVEATIASVRALTVRAYAEGAITSDGIYKALLSKLDEAAAGSATALQEYIDLLRAQQGKEVTEAWADRLSANASYVLTHP